jgi:hypothetical protein
MIGNCSLCGKDSSIVLESDFIQVNWRGTKLKVKFQFYKCYGCLQEFTTTETDTEFFDNLSKRMRKLNILKLMRS